MKRIEVIALALALSLALFVSLWLLLKYDTAINAAINERAMSKVSEIMADRQTMRIMCSK